MPLARNFRVSSAAHSMVRPAPADALTMTGVLQVLPAVAISIRSFFEAECLFTPAQRGYGGQAECQPGDTLGDGAKYVA